MSGVRPCRSNHRRPLTRGTAGIPMLPAIERHGIPIMQAVPLDPERISGYDAASIVTHHDAIVARHAKAAADARSPDQAASRASRTPDRGRFVVALCDHAIER